MGKKWKPRQFPDPGAVDARCPLTRWVVRVDDNACQQLLWERHHEEFDWQEDISGLLVSLGSFARMPVNIELSWATIGGLLVVFVYPCSLLVHHQMVDRAVVDLFPASEGSCDVMNFGNMLVHIDRQRAIKPHRLPPSPTHRALESV